MKRILLILLVPILLMSIGLSNPNTSEAACRHWSQGNDEPLEGKVEQHDKNNKLDETVNDEEDGTITIMCSGGVPSGWGSVRAGASYSHKTGGGTKIYTKNGGSSKANTDFNSVASNVTYRKYLKEDGSVTFVKNTPQGDVRFYKSHSGNEPSLSWKNEKIRYK
ncbi:hypothetical protein SAMN04489762_0157 [Terribacillus saccharophilus]|uniref:Uncharacterized protein n=1 Tax=Terribacillus saccharophilus TaxID=361277 RepID=A0AAX2E945_9BACI|nr:hypothetical protein SAMN04489762_0157 [Terribacillus saccharophilus]